MPEQNIDSNGGVDPNATPAQVTFTPEQQAAINKIIEDRIARAKSKAETDKQAAVDAAKAEFDANLAAERAKQNKKANGSETEVNADALKDQYQALLNQEKANNAALRKQYEDEVKSRAELTATNKAILKNQAIREALEGQDTFTFHNPKVVQKLTEDTIFFDEELGTYVVKDERGLIVQNSSLQPITLKEYFSGYGAQNPFLVKSGVKGGTGAGESGRTMAGGLASITSKADFKTNADKSSFISKFGYDAFAALPTK